MMANLASKGFRKVSMDMVDLAEMTFSHTSLKVVFTEWEEAAGQVNAKEERTRSAERIHMNTYRIGFWERRIKSRLIGLSVFLAFTACVTNGRLLCYAS
jgi:hypothetical protein